MQNAALDSKIPIPRLPKTLFGKQANSEMEKGVS
jgi:hypothetical protein